MSTPTLKSHWHHPVMNFKTSSLEFYAAVRGALTPHNLPDIKFSTVTWKEGGLLSARREYLRIERQKLRFDVCAAPIGEDFFFSWWLTEQPMRFGFLRLLAILFGLWILLFIIGGIFGALFAASPGAVSIASSIASVPLGILTFIGVFWGLGTALHNGYFGSTAEEAVIDTPIIGWLYVKLFGPNTYFKIDTTLAFQGIIHGVVTEVVNECFHQKGLKPLTDLQAKPVMRGLLGKAQNAGG